MTGRRNPVKRRRASKKRKRKERLQRDRIVTEKHGRQAHQACGRKVRYRTREMAIQHAFLCRLHGLDGLNVYKCRYCGGWHLTKCQQSTDELG